MREKWDYRKLCDIDGNKIYATGGLWQHSASATHALLRNTVVGSVDIGTGPLRIVR